MAKDVIEEQKAKLTEPINPEDIIIDDDSDMPEPATKDYSSNEQKFKCTDKFMKLFGECIGNMPYATQLSNAQGGQIRLIDLVSFVEKNYQAITADELNTIIGFLAYTEFKYVRPLMEIVEKKDRQSELWEPIK